MSISEPQTHENTPNANGTEPHFKPGAPIPWFARQPINDADTLLDLRYLCRGGGMLVIAPSGLGKSTLSIQIAILWSCGRSALGITTKRPLRILVVQAEDDQGDCTEMSQMIDYLGLDDDQLKLVEQNTEVIRCNDLSGKEFIKALKAKLQEARDVGAPFDLIIINPYSTYLGEDVLDAAKNIQFLNCLLNPVLSYFKVGVVVIHHTPKTTYTKFEKFNAWDFQYAGAGSASMTNWARAILVIVPQEHDEKVFMFVAAKRGKRLQHWDTVIRYFKHADSTQVMQWLEVTEQEKKDAKDAKKKKGSTKVRPSIDEIILKCVSLTDWLTQTRIYEIAQEQFGKGNCGEDRVDKAIKQGVIEDKLSWRKSSKTVSKPLPEYIRNNPNTL